MPRKPMSSDGAALRSALAALNHRLRREDAPDGLGPAGLGVLALLSRAGAANASELAEMANVQPQSLTRTLAALEKKKLIGRRPDEEDRRRAILWLTPKGEDALQATMRKRVAWLNAALAAKLSEKERDILRAAVALMERLAERTR